MSGFDWTLLAACVIAGAFIVLGLALLWYAAKGVWALGRWVRG